VIKCLNTMIHDLCGDDFACMRRYSHCKRTRLIRLSRVKYIKFHQIELTFRTYSAFAIISSFSVNYKKNLMLNKVPPISNF